VRAVVRLYSPMEFPIFGDHFGPPRTGDTADPFEADLYSVLEKGGLEIVRFAAAEGT
jgi:hypothetical protein